jgi:hypothetical protein
MQTDSERTKLAAQKDREIADLKAKIAEYEGGGGPDLVLDEYAFTYTWRGETHGLNVADLLTRMELTPDKLRVEGKDEADLAAEIKREAGMPDDLPLDHVLRVVMAAVKKTNALGKDIESA